MDLSALLHAAETAYNNDIAKNRMDKHVSLPEYSDLSGHHHDPSVLEKQAVLTLSQLISDSNTKNSFSPDLASIPPSPSLSLCGSATSSPPLEYSSPPNMPGVMSILRALPTSGILSSSKQNNNPHDKSPLAKQSVTNSSGDHHPQSDTPTPDYLVEPPKPFVCTWNNCKKAFPRKADLTRHERIHQNIRPFVCNFEGCNKAFSQRSALKVHHRIHTGEKPHVCPYDGCDKSFSDSSSLARHRKLHTSDGMTYVCDHPGCELKFSKKIYLLRHKKVTHGSGNGGSNYKSPQQNAYPTPKSNGQSPLLNSDAKLGITVALLPSNMYDGKSF